MLGDAGLDQLGTMGGERGEWTLVVLPHELAIASYVINENCGQPSLHAIFGHGDPSASQMRTKARYYVRCLIESITCYISSHPEV